MGPYDQQRHHDIERRLWDALGDNQPLNPRDQAELTELRVLEREHIDARQRAFYEREEQRHAEEQGRIALRRASEHRLRQLEAWEASGDLAFADRRELQALRAERALAQDAAAGGDGVTRNRTPLQSPSADRTEVHQTRADTGPRNVGARQAADDASTIRQRLRADVRRNAGGTSVPLDASERKDDWSEGQVTAALTDPPKVQSEAGDWLQVLLAEAHWTQLQLADAAGLSLSAVTRAAAGQTRPRATTLIRCANALGRKLKRTITVPRQPPRKS